MTNGWSLDILAAVSIQSGALNEDVIGWTTDCAWVIDGATGVGENILGCPSDAAWFAETISEVLERLFALHPELSTQAVLRRAVEHASDRLKRDAQRPASGRHEHPSASVAIARVRPEGIELTTLGDCQIAYRDGSGGAHLFGVSDVAPFESRTLELAARLLRSDAAMTPSALRRAVLPQLEENRRLMNVADGYWVLSLDYEALDHLQQITLSNPIGQLCLASDGFLRLHDLFKVLRLDDILDIRSPQLATEHMERLRLLEMADKDCRSHIRIKPSDDASIIAMKLKGGAAK